MLKTIISKGWSVKTPTSDGFVNVDLPHDYSISQKRTADAPGGPTNGFFQGGFAEYRKELTLDGGHYILDFDGAYMHTTVSLNGKELAFHPHGYTPLLVDITDEVKVGEVNSLVVTTDALQCSTRWYSGAGLYRDVALWTGGDVRIEPWDIYVTTPTLDSVHVDCKVASDRDATVTVKYEILDGDAVLFTKCATVDLKSGAKTTADIDFTSLALEPWSPDSPKLYVLRTTILDGKVELDVDVERFGVRTVSVDVENGLLFNGKTLKLKGGCIHHDHGVLGAAEFPTACRRKLTKLKAVGFNALRIAHNPPSTVLMDIADELGLILMDEAFDCWKRPHGGEHNYFNYFEEYWARDIAAMVRRDRKHTSVIAFSTGNEVPESQLRVEGGEISKMLADEVRKHDTSRIVTSCTYQSSKNEEWVVNTENYFAPLDMCGYNYLYRRYATERELFPNRVIWGSETQVLNFYDSWQATLDNSHVVGDFTWTAYDNLGENGAGRFLWAREGETHRITLMPYPWRCCYQGDFDIAGYRRPQSFFREAVWGKIPAQRIFTTHPEHYGEGFSGTGWHWYDVHESWTFDGCYIGKPVKCEVYTTADEVEWLLNGEVVGRTAPVKAIATIDIPYAPGTLMARTFKDGRLYGECTLHTVGAASKLVLSPETSTLIADNRDLCYVDIDVCDERGDRVTDSEVELVCTVEGGELMGIFGGNPKNEDEYTSNVCHAYDGRAVAIIRANAPGAVKVSVAAEGLAVGEMTVAAR